MEGMEVFLVSTSYTPNVVKNKIRNLKTMKVLQIHSTVKCIDFKHFFFIFCFDKTFTSSNLSKTENLST